jgi:hypothetical protein
LKVDLITIEFTGYFDRRDADIGTAAISFAGIRIFLLESFTPLGSIAQAFAGNAGAHRILTDLPPLCGLL